ncbi:MULTISPECIES: DUF3073 domain-containing protein [Rathayibacter]|uniref:DUF3073 domain-containing protein n=1 Tax=Rathayibacter TaxID=33886 RepID=UPI00070042F8|nr:MULTISPECIES: DUF3073 domain-containing protein [Rathayibacter]KQQ00077.1 hypothetical protein ASF42_17005 [Rathayibacter sp. Leaf294]KQS09531.1 hypothetical protein ASG06_17005 [Rathayibacter sp. Leaf185]QHC65348.1 DUF3073 family protein [Rathayibacter sp. VKM Ac-2759]WKK73171.1 DUF3073 domain-containing protein [Rathayibacter oskolensis]
MGRGRQKAKNTKIARELKSFSPTVDYSALERELSHPDEPDYSKWIDPSDDEGDDTDFVEEQHQKRA